jgi:hypothetical protein
MSPLLPPEGGSYASSNYELRTANREPRIALHHGRREADIDAVDVGDHVTEERKRNQPARDPRDDLPPRLSRPNVTRVGWWHAGPLYRN